MILYLVRHGETIGNQQKVFQGWLDLSLNDTGRKQAARLAEELAKEEFSQMYVSPLKRACETGRIIQQSLLNDLEMIEVDAIKEMNFGLWEGLHNNVIMAKYLPEYQNWLDNWQESSVPEGESAREMYQRVIGWLKEILQETEDGKLLIVTHEGVILQIISYLLGLGLDGCWHFCALPGSLAIVEVREGFSRLTKLNHRPTE